MMDTLKHKQVSKTQNVHRQSTDSNNKCKQQSLITTIPEANRYCNKHDADNKSELLSASEEVMFVAISLLQYLLGIIRLVLLEFQS